MQPRTPSKQHFAIAILGAGASGLWAAKTAALANASVCVLDHAKTPARKLAIAGGGKCNFTNRNVSFSDYCSENPHFVKSALSRFSPWEILSYLETHGIAWEEREHGQLFCRNTANDLIDALCKDTRKLGVVFRLSEMVVSVQKKDRFLIRTKTGEITADCCIVALGGPVWPQVGASDLGFSLAKSFGHRVIPAKPALVPFLLSETSPLRGLPGISLPATVSCNGHSFTENLLFTHKGISGPVVLNASCHWKKQSPVTIDFLPGDALERHLLAAGGKPLVRTICHRLFPERFCDALLPSHLAKKQIAQLSGKEHKELEAIFHRHTEVPTGTMGMKKAEVTAGGVATDGVSSKTMESRKVPGLFFTGEVLDVAGHLGGFNLHWAWASGQAAGEAAARMG